MDAAEVEFLAEKELVTIIPNFSLDKIYLIGGDLGPFTPGLPVDVPLWLAINLKQRQKCRLTPPEWMDVEKLEKIRDHERKEETFTPMPSPCYMELTKLLLNHASDNIPKADEIRTLIKDVWDTRIAKLRVSADSFVRQQEAHAQVGGRGGAEGPSPRQLPPRRRRCLLAEATSRPPGSSTPQPTRSLLACLSAGQPDLDGDQHQRGFPHTGAQPDVQTPD
uniref:GINS complex subunit 2 n=1 Tax=Suricata suricatta TaxID=37032 RepID=A0A673VD80_SURSU